MHIETRFAELVAIKARKEKRRISRRMVVEETGISLTSIQNWANNNVTQFHQDQIVAFCKYFDCTIDELLILVEDETESEGEVEALAVA
jgi:DNA-binding Xre family transcriptional regulator